MSAIFCVGGRVYKLIISRECHGQVRGQDPSFFTVISLHIRLRCERKISGGDGQTVVEGA